jgi:pimeloyl-ACP methyl ester carboxylesterase
MFRVACFALVIAFSGLLARPAAAEEIALSYDGMKVNATLTMADGKTMDDGIVLLLHGTLAHHKMEIIRAQQQLLAERGISSLAPSLSYGISDRKGMYDCKVPHVHRNEDALDEIRFWLDYLKDKGATEVTLAGHSRGGMEVSWFMAERGDDAVKRVILIASGQWDAAKAAKGFKKTHKGDMNALLEKAKGMDGDAMMKGIGILYCPGADVSAKSFVSYYGDDDRRDSVTTMQKIDKPVLVVVGTEDNVAAGLAERVRPLADAGKLQLVEVEAADHFFRDLFGEDLADAMQEFIEAGAS